MSEFLNALGTFSCGFVLGYFWYPMWDHFEQMIRDRKIT